MLEKGKKSILIFSIILGIFFLGLVSACKPVCGDGNLDLGEECDDGNSEDYDLCSNDCKIQYCDFELIKTDSADPVSPGDELSYHISLTNIGTAKCTGGGVQLKEYYDEYTSFVEAVPAPTSGNNLWNFGTIMPGVTKTVDVKTSVDKCAPCDETIVNEVCVWALEIDEWRCVEETTQVYCEPPEPVCGNGILEDNEKCDYGEYNGVECVPEYGDSCQYCNNTCEIGVLEGPYCGDCECNNGYETCETCPQDCGECPPEPPVCGNGILESGEECDDGNLDNGDGCSASCTIEEEDNDGNGRGGRKTSFKLQQFCDVNWECSGWSECDGGSTTRTCKDTNHCEDPYNKPIEKTGCVEEIISKSLVDEKGFNIPLMLLIITTIILILVLIALSGKK